jgi:putative transposase
MIDAQTGNTTDRGGAKGFDGAQQSKGRKRPILVDTLGLRLAVVVTAASVQARDGAQLRLRILRQWCTRWRGIGADGASAGALETSGALLRAYRTGRLAIVKRSAPAQGFIGLPKRWIVARPVAWWYPYRRLSKDDEYLTATSDAMIYMAMMHLMVRRIAAKTPF